LISPHGLIGSLSCRVHCWDNAVMARFFRSLKQAHVWQYSDANDSQARWRISEYI
jgi:transposase InsO family protein